MHPKVHTSLQWLFFGLLTVSLLLWIGGRPGYAQSCFPVPSGTIAWWPGDGDSSDLIASHDAQLHSGAGFATGFVWQAFSLDGVDDVIQIPFDLPFDFPPGSSISIDAWIYPTSIEIPPGFTVYGGPILAKGQDNGSRNWSFAIGGDDGLAHVSFTYSSASGLVQYSTNTSPIQTATWHHVAVSYVFGNASSIKIFVDGQQAAGSWTAGTGNESPVLNDFSPRIGGEEDQLANDRFAGYLDEVTLYDRALSSAEILAIFQAGTAGKCKDEDGDGFRPPQDCDESSVAINPNAIELPGNFVDENCDGNLGTCDPCNAWRTHGEYVRCVSGEVELLVKTSTITQEEGDALVGSAARSDVGKRGFVPAECQ